MSGERTEKPTPRRRNEARKKGQVARSNDMNGAIVMLAALVALGLLRPKLTGQLENSMYHGLTLISTPDVVSREGIGSLLSSAFGAAAAAVAPILFVPASPRACS